MKNLLVMGGLGLVLFVGTIALVLGMQGRLNREGLQAIPLVASLLPPPPPEDAAKGKEKDGKEKEHEKKPAASEPGTKDDGKIAGLAKEKQLPYRRGTSLFEAAKANDGHGGGHGSEPDAKASAHEPAHAKPEGETAAGAGHEAAPKKPGDSEWEQKAEDMLGQGQYAPGRLFEFPRLSAGISVDSINEILADARALQKANQDEKGALAQRKSELDARENDVRDRQEELAKKIREVEGLRTDLEAQITKAQGTVLMVRAAETQRWRENAKSVAALEANKAAGLIVDWWKTEGGQEMALKTLALMDPDARDQILNALSLAQLREVLERRLKVYVEPQKKEGGK